MKFLWPALAAAKGGPPIPSHHSPLFKVDPQAVVTTGATAMTAAVLDLLKPGTVPATSVS